MDGFTSLSNYLTNGSNYIYAIDIQICVSATFKDNTSTALWATYPKGKVCVEVPWWYAFVFGGGVGILGWMLWMLVGILVKVLVRVGGGIWYVLKLHSGAMAGQRDNSEEDQQEVEREGEEMVDS